MVGAAAVTARKSPPKQATRSPHQEHAQDSGQSKVVVIDVPSAPIDPESEGEGEGRELNLPLPVSSPEEMMVDNEPVRRTPRGGSKLRNGVVAVPPGSKRTEAASKEVNGCSVQEDVLWPAVDENGTEEHQEAGKATPLNNGARSKSVFPSTNTHTVQVC
jgi:hypothetical protein